MRIDDYLNPNKYLIHLTRFPAYQQRLQEKYTLVVRLYQVEDKPQQRRYIIQPLMHVVYQNAT